MCGKLRNNPCPLGDGGVDNIEPLTSVIILSAVDDETVFKLLCTADEDAVAPAPIPTA